MVDESSMNHQHFASMPSALPPSLQNVASLTTAALGEKRSQAKPFGVFTVLFPSAPFLDSILISTISASFASRRRTIPAWPMRGGSLWVHASGAELRPGTTISKGCFSLETLAQGTHVRGPWLLTRAIPLPAYGVGRGADC